MMLPTIHLNGTSAEALQEGYCTVADALYLALKELIDNGPNARDYYPQGDEAYREAAKEHEARIRKVQEIRAEILQLQVAILDQEAIRLAYRKATP